MKKRNYIAPIIVAAILLLYYAGFAALLIFVPGLLWWLRLILCIAPALLGALVIFVLVQRIRELNSGENDDLDKY